MGIARSGIGWMIARIGALGVTWLASLYFTRALVDPQASLGTFYTFETIVSFLVLLANAGLNGAIVKRVSEGKESAEFATAGLLLSGTLVFVVCGAVILGSPFLIDFFGYGGLSVIVLIGTLIGYQTKDTLIALLAGEFQVGRSGAVDFVDAIGQVGVQVALISAGFGVAALMVGYLAGSVAAAIVAIGLMFQRFNFARPSKHHFQSLIDFAKYNFLNGFVQKFYDNVDIIVITALLGKSATGVYGIGFQFSMLLTVFYSAINRASNPEISKYHTQGDYERIKEVMSDAIVLGLLIGIPAFTGFVVLARPIIVTFYTQEFAASTMVAVGAVATRIPEGLRSSLGSILAGVDRPDIGFHGGVILMVTNLVLDVILIPVVGVVGAVVASFIAMSLQLSYMGYHLINILDLSANDFPIWDVLLEIMAACLMAAVIYTAQSVVNPSSFISVFGLVLGGVCIYFITILLISADIRSRLVAIFRDLLPVTA